MPWRSLEAAPRRARSGPIPRIPRMTRTRWWLAGALVLGGVGLAGWWWQRAGEAPVSYRTAKIERGPLVAAVSSSGTVNPVTQVSVGSQVSGQIKEMRADFNTEVKQGQLIARLDPESFEYKVRQASADLESARAAVLNAQANVAAVMAGVSKARLEADNAQRDAQRKQDLLAQNFISQAEHDNARNTAASLAESLKVSQAQADVARAQAVAAQAVVRQREAALSQARVDLERTEIRSPVDGVVIKRSVDVGQTVAASLQAPELFIIARNLQDMQVDASIDEADIARIKLQQPVTFRIDAFPAQLRGPRQPDPQGRGGGAERGDLHRGRRFRQPGRHGAAGHDGQRAHRHRYPRERAEGSQCRAADAHSRRGAGGCGLGAGRWGCRPRPALPPAGRPHAAACTRSTARAGRWRGTCDWASATAWPPSCW